MQKHARWNRRQFVQILGLSSISTSGLCTSLLPGYGSKSNASFVYVGSADNALHVFATGSNPWTRVQTIKSERPIALALAPNRKMLYVVNEIACHRGLPVGTVEVFSISDDGRLAPHSRRELALSATMPRHAAVSPDGRSLVVAAHGGGSYNVLPIAEDGSLGRVSAALKETGFARGEESLPASHRW